MTVLVDSQSTVDLANAASVLRNISFNETIIAFTRSDGKVVLYDSIGLYVGRKSVWPFRNETENNDSGTLDVPTPPKRRIVPPLALYETVKRTKHHPAPPHRIPPVTIADIDLFSPPRVTTGKRWSRPRISSNTFASQSEHDPAGSQPSLTRTFEEPDLWITSESDDSSYPTQEPETVASRRRGGHEAPDPDDTGLSTASITMPGGPQPLRYRTHSQRSSLTLSSEPSIGTATLSSFVSESESGLLTDDDRESTAMSEDLYQTAPETFLMSTAYEEAPQVSVTAAVPVVTPSEGNNEAPLRLPVQPPFRFLGKAIERKKRIQHPPLQSEDLQPGKADSPGGAAKVQRFFPRISSLGAPGDGANDLEPQSGYDALTLKVRDLISEVQAQNEVIETGSLQQAAAY